MVPFAVGARSAMALTMPVPIGPMWASAPTVCVRRWCLRYRYRAGRCGHRPLRCVRPAMVHLARRHGQIDNPPLRSRLRSSRRGRCPHRPASFCVQGSPPNRTVSHPRRRGGLYGRPEPGYDSHRGSMVPFAVGVRSAMVRPTRRSKMHNSRMRVVHFAVI